MTDTLKLELDIAEPADTDNITDWCLEQFHNHYGSHITKDDIWEYLYGVMHAPDWRERYKHDLQRNLPRVPLAPDFEAFRAAGRTLMDLHVNYETVDEHPVVCLVDGQPDAGEADPAAYRIETKMRWAKQGKETDRSTLEISPHCPHPPKSTGQLSKGNVQVFLEKCDWNGPIRGVVVTGGV